MGRLEKGAALGPVQADDPAGDAPRHVPDLFSGVGVVDGHGMFRFGDLGAYDAGGRIGCTTNRTARRPARSPE